MEESKELLFQAATLWEIAGERRLYVGLEGGMVPPEMSKLVQPKAVGNKHCHTPLVRLKKPYPAGGCSIPSSRECRFIAGAR